MPLNLSDIQGVIHHTYHYPYLRHLLFEITSPAAGQNFLRYLVPLVTHAALGLEPKPEVLVNVGISYRGLLALGVAPDLLLRFPADFKEEPDPNTMGDVGTSGPENWWNRKFKTSQIHLIIHVFSQTKYALDETTRLIRGQGAENHELMPTLKGGAIESAAISDIPGELHFGYRDGISKLDVHWDDDPGTPGTIDYRHFILGYPSDAVPSQPKAYPTSLSSGRAAEFAKNGSYSVFRWLYQDVARFNLFLATEGPRYFLNCLFKMLKSYLPPN